MTNPEPPDRGGFSGSAMAGFIVWLARQRLPRDDRWSCTRQVEQFLAWQHHQREQGLDYQDEAYYAYLHSTGAGEVMVDTTRTAIKRLRQYLRTAI